MKSTSAGWINLLIVWGVASAAGFFAMAGLMLLGDWSLVQAIFGAAVVFAVLGTLLSVVFLSPLPGPQRPGSAGWKPAAVAAKSAAPEPAKKAAAPPAAVQDMPSGKVAPAAAPAPAEAAPGSGTRPAALKAPRDGKPDDLKRIKGIGPKLEQLCHSLGFFHFDQIAVWTSDEILWVDQNLEGFKGRVVRDDWVAQARQLAADG
jgi:predicted flap endonuclease-1-like 5' DNA nuclease